MHVKPAILFVLGLAIAAGLPAPRATASDATAIALHRTPGQPHVPLLRLDGALTDGDAERIRRLVRVRRGMMQTHQVLSVILLPVAGAAAVMGTINRASIDGGQGITPGMLSVHRGLAIGTAGLYTTTGLLAISAPHPLRDTVGASRAEGGKDSSRIHRTLAVFHAIVFGALLATGIIDANAPLSADAYAVLNKIHVAEGWAFFSLLTVSAISISFY